MALLMGPFSPTMTVTSPRRIARSTSPATGFPPIPSVADSNLMASPDSARTGSEASSAGASSISRILRLPTAYLGATPVMNGTTARHPIRHPQS